MEPTRNDSRRFLAWRPAAVLLVLGLVPPAAVAADPGETLPEPPRNAPLPVTVAPRIEFDRPMRPSYSVVGGGPNFPELRGTPSWDARKKVFTVPVKLKPDWSYEFGLNSERFQGFASAGGIALEPMEVRFRTGAAR